MAKNKAGTPTPLGPDDWALWRRVAENAKPLRRARPAPTAPPPLPPEEPKGRPADGDRAAASAKRAKSQPTRPPAPTLPALAHGSAAGVDRATADKLRRGLLPIEGRLDLHGHRQAEAHRALIAFIEHAWRAQRRCLLLITGKGGVRPGEGVLREAVPRWLNEAPLRARILAFAAAQPKDGGGGALYLLLKRQR